MAQSQQAGEPNRRHPKIPGKNKFAHTADTPYGMGDYYGTGVRAKIGRVRDSTTGMITPSKKQLGIPPKSLA